MMTTEIGLENDRYCGMSGAFLWISMDHYGLQGVDRALGPKCTAPIVQPDYFFDALSYMMMHDDSNTSINRIHKRT